MLSIGLFLHLSALAGKPLPCIAVRRHSIAGAVISQSRCMMAQFCFELAEQVAAIDLTHQRGTVSFCAIAVNKHKRNKRNFQKKSA